MRNMRSARAPARALALGLALGLALTTAGPVMAQGVYAETPGNALSRHIRVLASNPRDFTSLIGAGRVEHAEHMVENLSDFLRAGLALRAAAGLALAADTISITIMEIVDNAIMLVIPGAMDAPLDSALFWGSLAVALVIAAAVALPVNYWLISRGRGHAVVHAHMGH